VRASAKIWVDCFQWLLCPSHPNEFSWSDGQDPILQLKDRQHVSDLRVDEFLSMVSWSEKERVKGWRGGRRDHGDVPQWEGFV
jgi:hypothetical protein